MKQRREDVRVLMTQDEKLKMIKKEELNTPDKKRQWVQKLMQPAESRLHEVALTKFEVRLMGVDYEKESKTGEAGKAAEQTCQMDKQFAEDGSDADSEASVMDGDEQAWCEKKAINQQKKVEKEHTKPWKQDATELKHTWLSSRYDKKKDVVVEEDGNKAHWALVRYGGPETELIEKHEWGAWRKHAKFEKKIKRLPKMRSPTTEVDEDAPTMEELEDENAYLRQRLEHMEKNMRQLQEALVEVAASDARGRRKVEVADSETQTDAKVVHDQGTGMPIVRKIRKGTQTAEKEVGSKKTQTKATGPMVAAGEEGGGGGSTTATGTDAGSGPVGHSGAAVAVADGVTDGYPPRVRVEQPMPSSLLRHDEATAHELAEVLRNPMGREEYSPFDAKRPSSAKARAEMQFILQNTTVPIDKLFALNADTVSASFGGGATGGEVLFTMLSPSLDWKRKAETGELDKPVVRRRSIYTEIRQQESEWTAAAGGQALRRTATARLKNVKREELGKLMKAREGTEAGGDAGGGGAGKPEEKSRRWWNKQREKKQQAGAAARRTQREMDKAAPADEPKGSLWKKK
jgi:hypothetical protein